MALPGLEELAAGTRAATEAIDPTGYLLSEHSWRRDVVEVYRKLAGLEAERARVQTDAAQLMRQLELHIRKEEDAYFPAIEPVMVELGQGSTFDMYGEHDAIRIRLDELTKALSEGSGVGSAYAAFARALLIHFDKEEDLIFVEAPQHLSEETCRTILEQFAMIGA